MMMAIREPPSFGSLACASMLQQKQELSIADAREPGTEAPRHSTLVLGPHGVLVTLPVLSPPGRVWQSGSQKGIPAWRSWDRRTAMSSVMLSRVTPGRRILHQEENRSDLETAQVSGFTSWPKRWISASALIGRRSTSPFLRSPTVMCSFVIISIPPEPQRSTDRRPCGSLTGKDLEIISCEHEIHHQMDHVPGREVFTRIFVKCLVEFPD